MSGKNFLRETGCPFTSSSLEDAYGPEISLFLHCHLRGYDRHGEGKYPDNEYYDKYGAPMDQEMSWMEGYHVVEKKMADHFNKVIENDLDFPLIVGMAGGVHLYKPLHGTEDEKPWNWTGWIPRQKRWLSEGKFFSNRYFLSLRGNEIQNNLWDYHPHDEEDGNDPDDMEYSQLEPNDRYRGGYWFYRQPFGRYLHIIGVKSHHNDPKTNKCQRYNYVVHPLAYRASIHTIPDNTVDAMQWCLINMPEEGHFGEGQPWGDRCHGIEIFNDFTYYYSYQPIEEGGPNNGDLATDKYPGTKRDVPYYYYYFDTYPLEFCIFLLDTALTRGVYYHTLSANDAFYKHLSEKAPADPKGHLLKHNQKHAHKRKDPRVGSKNAMEEHERTAQERRQRQEMKKFQALKDLPYKEKTVFGYVTLFDPRRRIKETVFTEECGIPCMGLDEGEKLVLDYLISGRSYATTGITNLFDYDYHSLPFKIFNQPEDEELCYEVTDDMELVFTFMAVSKENKNLIWRYTIMVEVLDRTNTNIIRFEKTHGYFKLDDKRSMKLDLRLAYDKARVKWLYFSAIKPENPSIRAWLHTIRGPAFGEPTFHAKVPPVKHIVCPTSRGGNTIKPLEPITPTSIKPQGLDFGLGKDSNESNVYVYSMQAYSHQQDFREPVSDLIKESSDTLPPRVLQSVHGYFNLRADYPTRLNLSNSWDKVEGMVDFYVINSDTGEPSALPKKHVYNFVKPAQPPPKNK